MGGGGVPAPMGPCGWVVLTPMGPCGWAGGGSLSLWDPRAGWGMCVGGGVLAAPAPPAQPCPSPPAGTEGTAGLVAGLVAGTVALGLLGLGLYRIATEVYDRREFRRFQRERQHARWNEVTVPTYPRLSPNWGHHPQVKALTPPPQCCPPHRTTPSSEAPPPPPSTPVTGQAEGTTRKPPRPQCPQGHPLTLPPHLAVLGDPQ